MSAATDLLEEDQVLIADAIRDVCSGFRRRLLGAARPGPRVPVGLLRSAGRGRLVGARDPRGVRRWRPGHHRCRGHAPRDRRERRGDERLLGVHLTVFGLNPVVKFGNDRLKETFLPRAAAGELHVAFGVTEPDAGTDTGRITTRAVPTATEGGASTAARSGPAKRSSRRWCCSSRAPATPTAASRASASSSPTSIPTTWTSAPSPRSGATRSRRVRFAYDGLPVESWRLLGERTRASASSCTG